MFRKSHNIVLFFGLIWYTVVPHALSAIEVDTEELQTILNETIEFVNYTGPVVRFETDLQIRSIGSSLARDLRVAEDGSLLPGTSSFAQRYQITRIPPRSDSPLRGADVLEFLPGAAVDHIDNVRRIISGYLEAAFGYTRSDATTLSVFITVYNAVHRQAMGRFETRFNEAVVSYLVPEKVGLALEYNQWPGNSQIVIPLNLSARMGDLSSVAADEVASPQVIEAMRDTPEQGITERQEIADLMDRAVETETDRIQEERVALAREEEVVRETQQQVAQEISERQDALVQAQEAGDEQEVQRIEESIEELEREQEVLRQEQDRIEERQEVLDTREEIAAVTQERSDEVRREITQDLEQPASQPPPVETVVFGKSRVENQLLFTQLIRVNATDGSPSSPVVSPEFVGRSLTQMGSEYIGIQQDSGTFGNLFKFNFTSFQETARADIPVFYQSHMVYDGDSGLLYAVVFSDGDWYIGQFDSGLNIVQTSVIVVAPETSITLAREVLLVTRKDGRIVRLSRSNLRVD